MAISDLYRAGPSGMSEASGFTLKEVCALSQVSLRQLRYLYELGFFDAQPQLTKSQHRKFRWEDVLLTRVFWELRHRDFSAQKLWPLLPKVRLALQQDSLYLVVTVIDVVPVHSSKEALATVIHLNRIRCTGCWVLDMAVIDKEQRRAA